MTVNSAVYTFHFDADGDRYENLSFQHSTRVFAGVGDDAFAGDAAALEAFKAAFARGSYQPGAFGNRVNFFRDRTIAAVVLEMPNPLIANCRQLLGNGVTAWPYFRATGGLLGAVVARPPISQRHRPAGAVQPQPAIRRQSL